MDGSKLGPIASARLRERPTIFREHVVIGGRAAQKKTEVAMAAEICRTTPNPGKRVRIWKERTSKVQAAWYRRLKESRCPKSSVTHHAER
jgi:hypothetical protein